MEPRTIKGESCEQETKPNVHFHRVCSENVSVVSAELEDSTSSNGGKVCFKIPADVHTNWIEREPAKSSCDLDSPKEENRMDCDTIKEEIYEHDTVPDDLLMDKKLCLGDDRETGVTYIPSTCIGMKDMSIKQEPVDDISTPEMKDEVWSYKYDNVSVKEELVTQPGIPSHSYASIDGTRKVESVIGLDAACRPQHQIVLRKSFKQENLDKAANTEQARYEDVPTPTGRPFPVALYQIDATRRSNTGLNIDPSIPSNFSEYARNRPKYELVKRNHTDEKPHKCSFCPYSYSTNSSMKRHERTHTGEKKYNCTFCSYTCMRKGTIKSHERTHTGEKPFRCSFCPHVCSQAGKVKVHERIHTGEKPYKCTFCSYTCAFKTNLQSHEMTHTGEKPYKCSWCLYSCAAKHHMIIHERSHTGEKPFKCSFCPYSCSQASLLKNHLISHTYEKPFKCLFCSFSSSHPGHLKRHEKTHTKPFKCSFCSYSCSETSSLKAHETTHTVEKPHQCTV